MGTVNHLASHRRLPSLERVHGQLNAPGAVRSLLAKTWFWLVIALLCFGVLVKLNDPAVSGESAAEVGGRRRLTAAVSEPILVSYSYFEKDAIQRENLKYFIAMSLGGSKVVDPPRNTDFIFVVSGGICTPCNAILPDFKADWRVKYMPELTHVYTTDGMFLLYRKENEGMDFAAHNVTLQWMGANNWYNKYKYFIFLNSSVRGPFYPSYLPPSWQWTQAFTDRLVGDIKLVGSSLVCLPEVDAGGPGPKVESWAFAVDKTAMDLLIGSGIFYTRECKLCDDGVVVMGEYGLSKAVMEHGYNIATLMSMYPVGLDWRDQRHWHCNNNAHPSRHGTYDGISMHPFETVFIKASWHVGEPHLSTYTKWFMSQATREDTTAGTFKESLYRYAISPQAQEPNTASDCFNIKTTA
ncbi:g1929 [Coccomyxa elongata]